MLFSERKRAAALAKKTAQPLAGAEQAQCASRQDTQQQRLPPVAQALSQQPFAGAQAQPAPLLQLEQLTPHIAVIKNKTNVGVLRVQDKGAEQALYFIDSGNDAKTALEELALAERTYGAFSLKAVITTHSHADHSGGNSVLREKAGAKIWASKGEAALMEVPVLQSSLVYGGSPLQELTSPYLMAEPCAVDTIFPYEKEIQLSNCLSLRAVSLPGHYIDMAALVIHDKAVDKTVAFLADGISGRNVIKRYWIQYVYDEGLFKQSLERIKSIQADFYIPGHGDMVTDIEGLVELNQLAVFETEAMILDELKTPHTFEELLKAVADRNGIILKVSQYELIGSTIRSYLSSLQRENKVTYTITENCMRWQRIHA